MSARDDYPLVRALDALGKWHGNFVPSLRRLRFARLRPLHDYVHACRVEAPDVLHYVSDAHYDHRTDKAYNLLSVLKALTCVG